MTSTDTDTEQQPLAPTVGEAWADVVRQFHRVGEQFSNAIRAALDELRRTVSLVLPEPDEVAGDLAVWSGQGWRVELVGDQIQVTGGCAPGETTAVAAAMIAADRLRNTHTSSDDSEGDGE